MRLSVSATTPPTVDIEPVSGAAAVTMMGDQRHAIHISPMSNTTAFNPRALPPPTDHRQVMGTYYYPPDSYVRYPGAVVTESQWEGGSDGFAVSSVRQETEEGEAVEVRSSAARELFPPRRKSRRKQRTLQSREASSPEPSSHEFP